MRQTLKTHMVAYPLARRLMLIVIFWSILFTLVTAALQVFFEYQREMNQLDARMQQIRVTEVPSLTNSVWHFDKAQIETQLQGILNLQDIRYVQLQISGAETYTAGQEIPAADALSQTIGLEYTQNGETFALGQLLVVADIQNLRLRAVSWLTSILLSAAFQIFLLASFILFVVEWLLTRPLKDIVRYAENLDLDHLEDPLVLQHRRLAAPNDEMEFLAQKLNEMRCRLMQNVAQQRRMEAALRESERNYREIFNATSEAIFIHEISSSRILQVNASMLHMYGYASEAEALDRVVSDLSSNQPPFTQIEAERHLQLALTQGPQIFEWLARKKTGEPFWVEVSLRSSSIGGNPLILAVVRDITERKHAEDLLLAQNEELIAQRHALEEAQAQTHQINAELEKRVNERTAQLADLNQELEAFSYSVAHDLRAPLRHMNGASQIILEDYGSELNVDVKNWLLRIQDSAQNLTQMVDALLKLSHLTQNDLLVVSVDLSALAETIVAELHQNDPDRQVNTVIAPGLSAQADPRLVHIVLENLLGNAWKFTAPSQQACIELGKIPFSEASPETDHGSVYFVRDNGAGFDMANADRLFAPFQRLHSAAEFSGSGIGLATVKRIIQRHGGRVWAESIAGQGATFYFTLP